MIYKEKNLIYLAQILHIWKYWHMSKDALLLM